MKQQQPEDLVRTVNEIKHNKNTLNHITDESLDALRNVPLEKSLDLSWNKSTDEGLKVLADNFNYWRFCTYSEIRV